jgi:hypothetical protein
MNELDIKALMTSFCDASNDVLKTYQEKNTTNKEKPWSLISNQEKILMYQLAANDAIQANENLKVVKYECIRLWPCEYIMQPKWTNMFQYAKRAWYVMPKHYYTNN